MSLIGTKQLNNIFVGNKEVQSIFVGNNKVYQKQIIPIENGFLTFSSPNSFSLNVINNQKYWDGDLEYSNDKNNWNVWNGTTVISSASDGLKHVLYLRGSGNTYITGSSVNANAAWWKFTGTDVSIKGNIENLLDYETVLLGNHPPMANSCYRLMFNGCTALTTAPALSATALTVSCYQGMFSGCTALTTAPALPVLTLRGSCYRDMFYGCTALTTAPALPATTLTNFCYYGMFNGCTALTTIPALPATTLTDFCYNNMFNRCLNIKLSTTRTDNYQTEYRIPISGNVITTGTSSLSGMFANTGGTFTGTPTINTTYYTSNSVV